MKKFRLLQLQLVIFCIGCWSTTSYAKYTYPDTYWTLTIGGALDHENSLIFEKEIKNKKVSLGRRHKFSPMDIVTYFAGFNRFKNVPLSLGFGTHIQQSFSDTLLSIELTGHNALFQSQVTDISFLRKMQFSLRIKNTWPVSIDHQWFVRFGPTFAQAPLIPSKNVRIFWPLSEYEIECEFIPEIALSVDAGRCQHLGNGWYVTAALQYTSFLLQRYEKGRTKYANSLCLHIGLTVNTF